MGKKEDYLVKKPHRKHRVATTLAGEWLPWGKTGPTVLRPCFGKFTLYIIKQAKMTSGV